MGSRQARWYWRLPGAASPEDALDIADELGASTTTLYSQPSVPVCGTAQIERFSEAAIRALLDEARQLEREARQLREYAEESLRMRGVLP